MADRSDMGSSCCAPPPAVLAGVMKELKSMKKSPPDGIKVSSYFHSQRDRDRGEYVCWWMEYPYGRKSM